MKLDFRWVPGILAFTLPVMNTGALGAEEAGAVELENPETHGSYFAFAFSPDGSTVAGGTGTISLKLLGKTTVGGGEVVVWDARTGKIKSTLGSHGDSVNWVAFTADGRTLVSASGKNRRIRVWTLPQGKLKLDFELTASFPLDSVPVLSPDGSWLAAPMEEEYTEDGEKYSLQRGLSVWDLAEGKLSWKDESVRVNGLAASPDGKALAAFVRGVAPEGENRGGRWAPGEEYLTLWAASSGEITWTRGHKDLARQRRIAFSPDGKTILGLEKGKLIRWNRSTGEPIGEMKLQGDTSFPTELKIATDGRRAAVKCALSFTISFLDLEKGIPDGHLDVKQAIGCSAFSPDLERIVCEGKSHPVILDISRPLEATSDDD